MKIETVVLVADCNIKMTGYKLYMDMNEQRTYIQIVRIVKQVVYPSLKHIL